MDPDDSWQQHAADALKGSYLLANPHTVQIVTEGAARGIKDLERYGMDVAFDVWVVLVAFSDAYVAWDAFTRNPALRVMRYGWLLVTLYTGPIGAALHVLSCKEPRRGAHERFIAPLTLHRRHRLL